jgi:hypothetical protein
VSGKTFPGHCIEIIQALEAVIRWQMARRFSTGQGSLSFTDNLYEKQLVIIYSESKIREFTGIGGSRAEMKGIH